MVAFRKAREALSLACDENIITTEEYLLLDNVNTTKNFFWTRSFDWCRIQIRV